MGEVVSTGAYGPDQDGFPNYDMPTLNSAAGGAAMVDSALEFPDLAQDPPTEWTTSNWQNQVLPFEQAPDHD